MNIEHNENAEHVVTAKPALVELVALELTHVGGGIGDVIFG